jgi:hypothetical protein
MARRSGISNLGSVLKKLDDAKKEIRATITQTQRKVATDILQGVIEGTPEDTSVTVGDWQVGVNRNPTGLVNNPDPGGASALTKGKAEIAAAPLGSKINIVNNQPHVDGLNAGNAVTKPAGWIEGSIDRATRGA